MSKITFTVPMEENLSREFESICAEIGLDPETAFNLFAREAVRERKIPFDVSASDPDSQEDGMQAFLALREEARRNQIQDISLSEINEEIRKARYDRQISANTRT